MNEVGDYIRTLRTNEGLYLRELASKINIDQAILSKIERGERKATKDQIVALSNCFRLKEDQLLVLWLSDKVITELKDDYKIANKVLKVSEERIKYEIKK